MYINREQGGAIIFHFSFSSYLFPGRPYIYLFSNLNGLLSVILWYNTGETDLQGDPNQLSGNVLLRVNSRDQAGIAQA